MKSTVFQEFGKRSSSPGECVVGGTLALVLRISQYVGVAPLSFTATDDGWRIAVSPALAIFQRLFMTVLNVQIITALILDFSEDPDRRAHMGNTVIKGFVWTANCTLLFSIASMGAYRGPSRMKSLIHLLKQLQEINVNLNNVTGIKREKIGILIVTSMLIGTLAAESIQASLVTIDCIKKGRNWRAMVLCSSYYIAYVMRVMVTLQWGFVTLTVYGPAATVNERLLRLLHESELTAYSTHVQSTIRHLASSYGRIGELIRQMNEANGTILIPILMIISLHLILNPYYLLSRLSSGINVTMGVLFNVSWIILHISVLFLTVEGCHWTHEERETTKFLLSQLTVRLAPRCKLLAHELDLFVKQTILCDAKYTPLGVLTLGRPLVASMFGGVLSYFIILMQFASLNQGTK